MRNKKTIQKAQLEIVNAFRILFVNGSQDNGNEIPSTKNTYLMFHAKKTCIQTLSEEISDEYEMQNKKHMLSVSHSAKS